MKILLLLVSVLLLSTSAFAATLESRLDAKLNSLTNVEIPSDYTVIADDGKYVFKFMDLTSIPDPVINFLDSVEYPGGLKYTVQVDKGKVTSVTKGATTGYNILFGVTNSAANRILDSTEPLAVIKTEIKNEQIRYRAYGYQDAKLQFLKAIGGFIAGFSPQLAEMAMFLKGLK